MSTPKKAKPPAEDAAAADEQHNVQSLDVAKLEPIQLRVRMCDEVVANYAELMNNRKAGGLPPILVFHDAEAGKWFVPDGSHRLAAAKLKDQKTIRCIVREGTQREAVLEAAKANATHGLQRTNDDKRKAVLTLLADPEWCKWSSRDIAKACAVSHPFVEGIRKESEVTGNVTSSTSRTGADGKTRKLPKPKTSTAVKPAATVDPLPVDVEPDAAPPTLATDKPWTPEKHADGYWFNQPDGTPVGPYADEIEASTAIRDLKWVWEGTQAAKPHVAKNTGNPEWYTPADIVEAVRSVLGTIDLDPASCDMAQATVRAATYHTADDDGLSKDWHGNVFLNPPYKAGLIDRFVGKLVDGIDAGNVTEAVLLVNNATETLWFGMAAASAAAVCFPSGRVKFVDPSGKSGAPLQGQAVMYFGKRVDLFVTTFKTFGWVARIERNGK